MGILINRMAGARLDTRDAGVNLLLTDPFLRAYKDDPRFEALVEKILTPVKHLGLRDD